MGELLERIVSRLENKIDNIEREREEAVRYGFFGNNQYSDATIKALRDVIEIVKEEFELTPSVK